MYIIPEQGLDFCLISHGYNGKLRNVMVVCILPFQNIINFFYVARK